MINNKNYDKRIERRLAIISGVIEPQSEYQRLKFIRNYEKLSDIEKNRIDGNRYKKIGKIMARVPFFPFYHLYVIFVLSVAVLMCLLEKINDYAYDKVSKVFFLDGNFWYFLLMNRKVNKILKKRKK